MTYRAYSPYCNYRCDDKCSRVCCYCDDECSRLGYCSLIVLLFLGFFSVWSYLDYRHEQKSYKPTDKAKFEVCNAWLSQFDIVNDDDINLIHTLYYKAAINFSVTNPNTMYPYTLFYDKVEAIAYYRNQVIKTLSFAPMHVNPKSTAVVTASFVGKTEMLLAPNEVSQIQKNVNDGSRFYDIDLKLQMVCYPQWAEPGVAFIMYQLMCNLKVPMSLNGTNANAFKSAACYYN